MPEPRYHIAHEVWVARGSRLAAMMGDKLEGETCQVNSRHHQAVKTVAAGWDVSGTAPDGVIEAIEQPGHAFRLAVQWHPENFWRTGEFRPLFEGFIDAARSVTRYDADYEPDNSRLHAGPGFVVGGILQRHIEVSAPARSNCASSALASSVTTARLMSAPAKALNVVHRSPPRDDEDLDCRRRRTRSSSVAPA